MAFSGQGLPFAVAARDSKVPVNRALFLRSRFPFDKLPASPIHHMHRRRWFSCRGVLSGVAAGCGLGLAAAWANSYTEACPISGRKRLMLLTARQEQEIYGTHKFEAALLDGRAPLPLAHPASRVVDAVGRRLLQCSGCEGMFNFSFIVLDCPGEANAFSGPAGRIYVCSGLLPHLAGSVDDLSTVVAHELGHSVARHFADTVSARWAVLAAVRAATSFVGGEGIGQDCQDGKDGEESMNIEQQQKEEEEQQKEEEQLSTTNSSVASLAYGWVAVSSAVASFKQLVSQVGGVPLQYCLSLNLSLEPLMTAAASPLASLALALPYSGLHEAEADSIGLVLQARAGFDVQGSPALYARLHVHDDDDQQQDDDDQQQVSASRSLSAGVRATALRLTSTHPRSDERVQQLQCQLDGAEREGAAWRAAKRRALTDESSTQTSQSHRPEDMDALAEQTEDMARLRQVATSVLKRYIAYP